VQLTWKANYAKYVKVIKKDLITYPDLAMHPPYACIILVDGFKRGTFTGAKLEQYVNSTKTDFINARRCINGIDKASLIAGYADKWLRGM
jgi:predicted chitinase